MRTPAPPGPDPLPAGFQLLSSRQTDHGLAQLLRHLASGARVLLLPEPREEPVFSLSFPTRPRDNSGVAHVLEHLVFRGSARFPADPLYPALTEATMSSFLNASTRPDYTTFHAAAPCLSGLLPLAEVLLDAVLHPRLDPAAFREEAWDRPEGPGGAPRGVILSEMRAWLANPDAALSLALRAAVLGGGDGSFNQGGDPEALVRLTLQQVRDFHRAAFTPANAWLALWGCSTRMLTCIDTALCAALDGHGAAAPAQQTLPPVARLALSHPSGARRCGYAWRLPPGCPPEEQALLRSLLLDGPGALLRDLPGLVPGPGTDLVSDVARPYLSLAFDHAGAAALSQRLQSLQQGVDLQTAQAAVSHALTTWYDTDVTPRRPAGLQVFDPMIAPWLQGGDPFQLLNTGARLQVLQTRPDLAHARLQVLLRDMFGQDGPHSVVTLKPGLREPATLPPQGRALPFAPLAFADVPPDLPDQLPRPLVQQHNEIAVLDPGEDRMARLQLAMVVADPQGLPQLAAALGAQLSQDPALSRLFRGLQVTAGACGAHAVLWLQASLLPADVGLGCQALAGALAAARPVGGGEVQAQMRRMMLSRPQSVICARLRAGLSRSSALQDALAGPGLLLAPAAAAPDGLWRQLRDHARMYLAGSGIPFAQLTALRDQLGQAEFALSPVRDMPLPDHGDGFALPTAFHAVGLGFQVQDVAAARVLLRAAEAAVLWPELRGAGGAYGLRSELTAAGEAAIFTARDPHLLRSLGVMRGGLARLAPDLSQALLDRARIGAAGQLLTPLGPQARLRAVLEGQISGTTPWAGGDRELQQLRALTLPQLRQAAEQMEVALHNARPVVFGPQDSLEQALRDAPGLFTLHSDPQSRGSTPL